jgi:hypothetical protein
VPNRVHAKGQKRGKGTTDSADFTEKIESFVGTLVASLVESFVEPGKHPTKDATKDSIKESVGSLSRIPIRTIRAIHD